MAAVQQAESLATGETERQMLALVRYRLEHADYLHDSAYGAQLLDCFRQLQETYPMGFTRFHLQWGAGMVQGEPPVPPSLPPAGGVSYNIVFLPI